MRRRAGESGESSGWLLAGDAAHNVHPLAGQGLNLGLGDVQALARILQERDYWRSPGDIKLLRQYERERKASLAPMGLAMDGLQQLFAPPRSALHRCCNWGMKRALSWQPPQVMDGQASHGAALISQGNP